MSDARFLRLMLDESPDAVIGMTADDRIAFWSRGAERMLGFTREEALGSKTADLIVPPHRIEDRQRFLQQARRDGEITHETERLKKDGSQISVCVTHK